MTDLWPTDPNGRAKRLDKEEPMTTETYPCDRLDHDEEACPDCRRTLAEGRAENAPPDEEEPMTPREKAHDEAVEECEERGGCGESPCFAGQLSDLAWDLKEAKQIIRDLIEWGERLGTWESPCWRAAETFLQRADDEKGAPR